MPVFIKHPLVIFPSPDGVLIEALRYLVDAQRVRCSQIAFRAQGFFLKGKSKQPKASFDFILGLSDEVFVPDHMVLQAALSEAAGYQGVSSIEYGVEVSEIAGPGVLVVVEPREKDADGNVSRVSLDVDELGGGKQFGEEGE